MLFSHCLPVRGVNMAAGDKRRAELLEFVGTSPLLRQLVVEMVGLEEQLDELRDLPKIRINPYDKTKQKATPAARLQKECLSQYSNIVRILMSATGTDESNEESPLRKWAKERGL